MNTKRNPPQQPTQVHEKVITVLLLFNDRETEAHPIVTSMSPKEIAASWLLMPEVYRVIILDDYHDTPYILLWDSDHDQ